MNGKTTSMLALTVLVASMVATSTTAASQKVSSQSANPHPKPSAGTIDVQNFTFGDGEFLPSLRLHYLTLGTPCRDASGAITNAVLLLPGTASPAADLTQAAFFDALYGAGEPLDLSRYFLVIPDVIGTGDSSKPSDGLHAHFPRYGYEDLVLSEHVLLERMGIRHLKLVLGTSMGGMEAWIWGEMFPNDMDGLVAIATSPRAISGRNMMWREMISQAIRGDPAWNNGDYSKDSPPKDWINSVLPLSAIMTGSADQLQKQAPTRKAAIDLVDKIEATNPYDANDVLYAFESPADYDPAPRLDAIIKPMLIINFADDLLNPPELLHLPSAANYVEVMIPAGPDTYAHMTLAHPAVWASALQSFLGGLPPTSVRLQLTCDYPPNLFFKAPFRLNRNPDIFSPIDMSHCTILR